MYVNKHVLLGAGGPLLIAAAVASAVTIFSIPDHSTSTVGDDTFSGIAPKMAATSGDVNYGGMRFESDLAALRGELAALGRQLMSLTQQERQTAPADYGEQALAVFREELDALRAQVVSLSHSAMYQPRAMPPLIVDDPTDPPLASEDADQHSLLMDEYFLADETEPGWATDAETRIEAVLASEEMRGLLNDEGMVETNVLGLECSANMCRLELSGDDRAYFGKFRQQLAMQTSHMFPGGSVHRTDYGTVVYLVREGYDLPTL